MTPDARAAVAEAFREEWGRVVASLIRSIGDWDLAEECTQDAFAEALRRWPNDGVPRRPGAWLSTVARNRALDRLRRHTTETRKLQEATMLSPPTDPTDTDADGSGIRDDRLRLIFTCCHPALPLEARVALTLRTLAGLTTAEVARAFLVPEPTMAKRLVRAKRKIANAAIPYRVPPAHLLPQRVTGVLAVLYLLFNEGYSASTGAEPLRENLCAEAIRLSRALVQLMPDEPEATGLLALMLLQHSRRRARVDGEGEIVTLADQDRARWDRAEIGEATGLLDSALRKGGAGPYRLQAAIAACHANATDATATNWVEIAGLYTRLARVMPSPVVELNRAVAVAMADGPAAGLALVETLAAAPPLRDYYLLHATRADLLRRLGRKSAAAESYRRALALTGSEAERRFLARRLAEVTGDDARARCERGPWPSLLRDRLEEIEAIETEARVETYDDDLRTFAAEGAPALPIATAEGYVEHDGARIWYATYGSGAPVILLHGGLGHSGNWGNQVPTLIASGHRTILIDSRGHGRSTRDARPFTYEQMASDVLAVMDTLALEKAAVVGWSDGACIALILAMQAPARIAGVFFFGCNMDPSGTKEINESDPILNRCFGRHARDYAALSATPDDFKAFAEAVGLMQATQPNYGADDLAAVRVPVTIVQSEHDEFIKREHAEYLARSIPVADLVILPGVTHFAPLQRPKQFDTTMLTFVRRVLA